MILLESCEDMEKNLFKIDFTGRHTDTQEMMLFLYRATKCPTEAEKFDMQKWINWLWRALNETKYNRISFLVLLRLIFEKTTENNREELKRHVKINLKTRNQIISSPYEGILLFNTAREGWKLWIKKTKTTSQLFRDQSYLNCVVSAHLFLFSFVL